MAVATSLIVGVYVESLTLQLAAVREMRSIASTVAAMIERGA